MRNQLSVLIVLCCIFVAAVLFKALFPAAITGGLAYLFWATFWISAIMVVIVTAMAISSRGKRHQSPPPPVSRPDASNRRQSFRVIYPSDQRPILFVDTVDTQSKRQLEYSVIDISEEGICFMDDGSLGAAETVIGRLQFTNGATHAVTGEIVRRRRNRISVRLIQSLSWSTLLKEQRQLMTMSHLTKYR